MCVFRAKTDVSLLYSTSLLMWLAYFITHTHTESPGADGVAVALFTSCPESSLSNVEGAEGEGSERSPRVQMRRLKDGWCFPNHPNIKLGKVNRDKDCFLSRMHNAAARSPLLYGSMKF